MRIVIKLSVVALTSLIISDTFIKYFMAVLKTRYPNKWSSIVLTFLSPSVSLPCHNNVAILRFVYTSDFRVRFTVYTATKNALWHSNAYAGERAKSHCKIGRVNVSLGTDTKKIRFKSYFRCQRFILCKGAFTLAVLRF